LTKQLKHGNIHNVVDLISKKPLDIILRGCYNIKCRLTFETEQWRSDQQ